MKTTLTQTLKNKVKKAVSKYDQIQEELLEQIAASRSNRSLSRFTNSFDNAKKLQTL
jgi:hypothetical protein